MRHKVAGRKLNRSSKHRQALFKNLILSLIQNEQLKTTEAKAKAVKGLIDKLITHAKVGTVHSRRVLGSFLHDKKTVNKLVDDIAVRFKDRASGYTSTVRLGRRRGDDAMMVNLRLVDVSTFPAGKKPTKAKDQKSKPEKPGKTITITTPPTPKLATQFEGRQPVTKPTAPRTTHK